MINFFQAILLGVIQGVAEFFPVSSSGHLVLAQLALGLQEAPFTFDILVHFASLLAVIIFFFPQIKKLKLHQLFLIGLANVPVAVVGLLISNHLELLFGSKWIVVAGLLITGLLNLSIHSRLQKQTRPDNLSWSKAGLIGVFQALAIIPGISRSGSTLFASTNSGLSRERAFEFSFLISIPAILGANFLQLFKDQVGFSQLLSQPSWIAGGLTAFFVSLLSLRLLRQMIKKAQFSLFAYYCFGLALISAFVI
ncbi:MAG: hypothetical protein GF381_04380 [Candidatus Pacebacteria bacterium]|nr:hypothetical protein [Candidatus Paceibacterota bacterium]